MASPTTGKVDYTDKRVDYERYGVAEYWRFDPSGGDYHDAALAGDRLVDRVYEPIAVEMLEDSAHRGYSDALGLYVCWEDGRLRFFDPDTESYLRSHDEEHAERMATQARVAELEAELRRLRGEWAPSSLSAIVSRTRSFALKSRLKVDARKYYESLHLSHCWIPDAHIARPPHHFPPDGVTP